MGRKAEEALDLANVDDLIAYLREAHSAYMQTGAETYYLTNANDLYWRAQDTNQLNKRITSSTAASLFQRSMSSLTCPLSRVNRFVTCSIRRLFMPRSKLKVRALLFL